VRASSSASDSASTITLAGGGSWSSLGYAVGQGIFLGSATDPNANGATLDLNAAKPYYTITAINGAALTVSATLQPETGVTLTVAPVTVAVVNYGIVNGAGTITLANGGSWTGYAVGQAVFVGSTTGDNDANGTNFNTASGNPYYRITAINGPTLTISGIPSAFAPEVGATVTLAPVTVDININASNIGYVLVNQNKDVAVAIGGTLSATAAGYIFIGSQNNIELKQVTAGFGSLPHQPAPNVRIKTQGDLINAGGGAINVTGAQIVLEAGEGFIGTGVSSTTAIQVDILTGGSLTARAQDSIYIDAPGSDIPVDAIYSASPTGLVYLNAHGSIYDAVASDFAKLQANEVELVAGDNIGDASGNALHIDIVGTDPADGLRAAAPGNINIDAPEGSLNVLDAYSKSGNVTLGAAGSILNVGNLANPTDPTSAVSGGLGANVYGNTIVLDAGQGGAGGINGSGSAFGGATTSFNIASAYSAAGTVSANGRLQNIVLDEVPGIVLAGVNASTNTNDDISLFGISDVSAIAFITAGGNILNGRGDNNAIITSTAADLSAGGSVGLAGTRTITVNGQQTQVTNRIVSTVSHIDAQAASGSIYLWNIGAHNVGHVQGVVTPYALYAPKGSVDVLTSSPLEISQNILADGSITKRAGTVASADDNLTVDPDVTLQSLTSSITLQAGNNILLAGNGTNAATLEAVTGVTLVAGNYDTTAVASEQFDETVNFGGDAGGRGATWCLAAAPPAT
jgi:hypothetical protein